MAERATTGDDNQGIWPSLSSWREALQTPRTSPPDYWLLAVVGALIAVGLVMLYSASFALGASQHGNPAYYLLKQLLWVVIGAAGGLTAMRVDYRFWRRLSVPGMIVVMLLLALVLFLPESISEAGGSRRWIDLGPISIQPSQLAYLVFVVYIADWLSKRGQRLRQVAYGLVPFATIMGILAGLIMLEPDMGTSLVLVLIGAIVFLVAGADLKQSALAGVLSGGIFFLFARFSPYRWARLVAFVDPEHTDPPDIGYHLVHNKIALGAGGLLGSGLGQGLQKFRWLPSPHTDSIFAVIGEELGLVGCIAIAILFLCVAWRSYNIALRAPDRYGLLLGVGIASWLSLQAFMNMAMVAGILPFSGITLPFISYGGSSLACCMTATGLLLNISCHGKKEHARLDLGRGDWWSRLSRTVRRRRTAER